MSPSLSEGCTGYPFDSGPLPSLSGDRGRSHTGVTGHDRSGPVGSGVRPESFFEDSRSTRDRGLWGRRVTCPGVRPPLARTGSSLGTARGLVGRPVTPPQPGEER